jgi:hypothetical protein
MASYAEDLARWRAEREQAEFQNRVAQITDEYRAAARERDSAIADGDTETAAFRDDDCMRLEQEFLEYCPPQQPQMHPAAVEFLQKNRAFRERHGQAADQAIQLAHQYATRPRNPTTNNPALNGMGLQANSPQYFQAVRDLLTMYAKDHGLHYDPEEEGLTANEAAKISGVSANTYNRASQQLASQRRFSFQQGNK